MNNVFPVGEFIRDEMHHRRWSRKDLVSKMCLGNFDSKVCELEVHILLDAPTKGVWLGEDTANSLARAFGTSSLLWLNLDRQWQESTVSENAKGSTVS